MGEHSLGFMPNEPTIDYRLSTGAHVQPQLENFTTHEIAHSFCALSLQAESDENSASRAPGRRLVPTSSRNSTKISQLMKFAQSFYWHGRNVIFLPLFRNVWWLAELIYFGAVVQLTTLQQLCRYDVYE